MRRAIEHLSVVETNAEPPTATVTLSFEDRHRRRVRLVDDAGVPFLLDLPRAVLMHHGDRLRLDSGGTIEVHAAIEPVMELSCHSVSHAARVAWHVGNRHVPVQVLADGRLRLRVDHVLRDMALGLGAEVRLLSAPFAPEPGAYGGGHGHAH